MGNKNILTSVNDIVNFFTTVPHCSLTIEQLAETAFKVAENNMLKDKGILIIVPYNFIDKIISTLKSTNIYNANFEIDTEKSYNKDYEIWIVYDSCDGKNYEWSVYINMTYEPDEEITYSLEDSIVLLHKGVSPKIFKNITNLSDNNKVVTFDLLA
jgi:hypothetical protein